MALVTTPVVKAIVSVIMQEKEGEYGSYQSVLFEGEGLTDGKLWRALNPKEAQQLRKGQAVELTPTRTRTGKEAWNIRPLDIPPTQARSQQPTAPQSQQSPAELPPYQEETAEKRRHQIEAYVDSMGDLYAHCLEIARQKLGSDSNSETTRCMASSLFISAQRRFLLTSPSR